MVEIPNFGRNNKLIWVGLLAGAVALGIYLRKRTSSDATANQDTSGQDMANVDGSVDDAYSSGTYSAVPGTQFGAAGPPGPPGPRGQRGKRGPRGKPPKHKGNRHHKPAGSHAQPRIATQSHMANATPVASHVRVIQHRPGGVVAKGGRQSNG